LNFDILLDQWVFASNTVLSGLTHTTFYDIEADTASFPTWTGGGPQIINYVDLAVDQTASPSSTGM
jgi:hypothetical protein